MLCAREDRAAYFGWGSCPDCGGCIDDECHGCSRRWCGGMYRDRTCNRCPYKVAKLIRDDKGAERTILVRCNYDELHDGVCHWNT